MNILWLTNITLPESSKLMNEEINPFGSWLVNASYYLSKQNDVNLNIAFPKVRIKSIKVVQGEKICYYAFPYVKNKIKTDYIDKHLNEIVDIVKPDIVHIFGTEYTHTLAMVNICNKKGIKSVISIQGLVSIISKHYLDCIPERVKKRYTFRDLIKKDNLKFQQKRLAKSGYYEIEAIKRSNYIIGRTTWDQACVKLINTQVNYYFCNEILREEFYKHKWSIDKCERHSIFISQASYPIKGLHFMLEAMSFIIKKYPDAKLYIAGPNILSKASLKQRLRRTSYSKYIEELINFYKLNDNIVFTGILSETQMCERYLLANVFVSPSVVENESNSLSEAKILGVPSISSYVGGVIDRIIHNDDGFFYQFNAPYMLAYYICKIFEDQDLAIKFSENARSNALKINNREDNTKMLIKIYSNILKGI